METVPEFIQAVQSGDQAGVADWLLRQPGLVDARTEQGLPVVLLALYYNHPDLARYLAAEGAVLDIFCAAALGDLPHLRTLLAIDPFCANQVSLDGYQPLGLAAFFGQAETVACLLSNGAAVNQPSNNPMRVMPLHSAVAGGHLAVAQALLAAGADVNARQSDDFTPLHGAAQNGQAEMIQLLLDYGADREAPSASGKRARDFAVESGNEEALRLLA